MTDIERERATPTNNTPDQTAELRETLFSVWRAGRDGTDRYETVYKAEKRLAADRQKAVERAEVYFAKGVLNDLNQKLFFSTTQPDSQFVKDAIIEALEKLEHRDAELQQKGQD
jgi:hypothetical protein